MNLYLISQTENNDWDTFDSAVVAAESEEIARQINPSSYAESVLMTPGDWRKSYSSWASSPEWVTVKFLGVAIEGTSQGVICASFNAG